MIRGNRSQYDRKYNRRRRVRAQQELITFKSFWYLFRDSSSPLLHASQDRSLHATSPTLPRIPSPRSLSARRTLLLPLSSDHRLIEENDCPIANFLQRRPNAENYCARGLGCVSSALIIDFFGTIHP